MLHFGKKPINLFLGHWYKGNTVLACIWFRGLDRDYWIKNYVPLNFHQARFYSGTILPIQEAFLAIAHVTCSTLHLSCGKKVLLGRQHQYMCFSFSSCGKAVGGRLVAIESTKHSASPSTKSSDYHFSVILRSQASLITPSHPTISFSILALLFERPRGKEMNLHNFADWTGSVTKVYILVPEQSSRYVGAHAKWTLTQLSGPLFHPHKSPFQGTVDLLSVGTSLSSPFMDLGQIQNDRSWFYKSPKRCHQFV